MPLKSFAPLFTKELSPAAVYQNDALGLLVFLDQFPATRGHLLVVPREIVDPWEALSAERQLLLDALANTMALHLQKSLKPAPLRVGQLISGYGVKHAHRHVVPSYERGDMQKVLDPQRAQPGNRASEAELAEVLAEISFTPEQKHRLDARLQHLDTILKRLSLP